MKGNGRYMIFQNRKRNVQKYDCQKMCQKVQNTWLWRADRGAGGGDLCRRKLFKDIKAT